MSSRRATAAVFVGLVVAVAIRAAFLLWSPLPATLDGFRYASLAADIVGSGQVPLNAIDSDEFVTTILLGVASEVAGVRPLYLAQPLVAVAGGAAALGGYVVVRSVGRDWGWSRARIRRAGAVAVLALAVEGMFLRRTGVPDEEALGLLLLPLFALAVHRTLDGRQRRWVGTTLVLAVAYPLLHNFSGLAAGLVVTALAAIHLARAPDRTTAVAAVVVTSGYWVYFFGYFEFARRVGLRLTFSGLVSNHLGSLVAWAIALAVGVAWIRVASGRARRATFAVPLGVFFLAAGVNAVRPVFPGTIETPPLVLALVAVYVIPVVLFLWSVPRVGRGESGLALALVAAPAVLVLFTLTTSLSPQFFGTVIRAQSFLHAGVFALAGVTVVGVAEQHDRVGPALAVLLMVAALATAPFAFIHLDTGTAPRTVHESEFAAVSFASVEMPGAYTSEHRLADTAPLYYRGTGAGIGPVRTWLYGGPPPDCATLAQRSWTTDGAHLYPTAPATLPASEYREWKRSVDVVYSTNGWTETVLGNPGEC